MVPEETDAKGEKFMVFEGLDDEDVEEAREGDDGGDEGIAAY